MNESSEIKDKIILFLEEEISPFLRSDGGDVKFVKLEDGVVYLKLRGACRGCPMAAVTLKNFIEKKLTEQFEEVKSVKRIMDLTEENEGL